MEPSKDSWGGWHFPGEGKASGAAMERRGVGFILQRSSGGCAHTWGGSLASKGQGLLCSHMSPSRKGIFSAPLHRGDKISLFCLKQLLPELQEAHSSCVASFYLCNLPQWTLPIPRDSARFRVGPDPASFPQALRFKCSFLPHNTKFSSAIAKIPR